MILYFTYLPGQLVRFIVRENDIKITIGETIDDFRKRKTLYSRTSILCNSWLRDIATLNRVFTLYLLNLIYKINFGFQENYTKSSIYLHYIYLH